MKDIFYISNIKAIKTLASERRLKILRYLVGKEYASQDLAKKFKIKTNVIWYDIKQLEDSGLINLTRSEHIRGSVKRFYRAVAKNFFLDSSLGEADIDHSKKVQNLIEQELADWRREKIIKIDFKDLSDKIINQYLEIKEDEIVAISYQPMHQKLVEDLMVEIYKCGAYPIPIFWTKRIEYNFIKYVPEKYVTKDVIDDFLMNKIDAQIVFSGELLEDFEEDNFTSEMTIKRKLIEKVSRENIRKSYETKVRFLTIDTLQKKQIEKGKNPEICQDMYWKSLNVDVKKLQKDCEFVKDKLQNAKIVEIFDNKGNSLKITLPEQKRIELKSGIAKEKSADSELPAGMVVCLLKNAQIEGEFQADFAYVFDKRFKNISFRIVNDEFPKIILPNKTNIKELFETAEGDKTAIGSFCIGLNSEITKDIRNQYINSKIFGAASLQIGWDELQVSNLDSNMVSQFFMLNNTIKIDGKILFENNELKK